jgi:hypothetical protein
LFVCFFVLDYSIESGTIIKKNSLVGKGGKLLRLPTTDMRQGGYSFTQFEQHQRLSDDAGHHGEIFLY